ncbi:MAG TPA: CoA transferase, partial [Burkholderiales bacterium]|nr:CoA transferase [Burkholderiales bacterium]
ALGHPGWITDARFADNPSRVANQSILYPLIEAEMAKRTRAQWMELLEKAGVPCAPVQDIGEVTRHAQTEALGLLQGVPDSGMKFIGLPVSFDGERPPLRRKPPAIGEHTGEIFRKKT